MATKSKRKAPRTFYLVLEVDGKRFGLNNTFNPDAGTDRGDLDIFDATTGKYLDEMCGVSVPEEGDEGNSELKRITEYIRENLIF